MVSHLPARFRGWGKGFPRGRMPLCAQLERQGEAGFWDACRRGLRVLP